MVDDMERSVKHSAPVTVISGGKDITDQVVDIHVSTAPEPTVPVKVTGVWREKTYEITEGPFAEAEARRRFHDEFPDMSGAVWSVEVLAEGKA